jgi:hypothetical protein
VKLVQLVHRVKLEQQVHKVIPVYKVKLVPLVHKVKLEQQVHKVLPVYKVILDLLELKVIPGLKVQLEHKVQ